MVLEPIQGENGIVVPPTGYLAATDNIAVGPSVGSCGAAMATRKPVIVVDIANDPLWNEYRQHALDHGLRACWSFPIMADGTVFGTFGIYYGTVHAPSADDLQVASRLAKLRQYSGVSSMTRGTGSTPRRMHPRRVTMDACPTTTPRRAPRPRAWPPSA